MELKSSGASAPAPADADGDSDPEIVLRASMLDAIGEAVIATDPDGRIIYWNDAATRLYGWRADEVIGSNVMDVTVAGSLDDATDIMDRLRAGGTWSGEFLVQDREGRTFPAFVTDSAIQDADGRVLAIVGVSRDMSPSREAEESARHAEQRLEMVGRVAATAVWEWDARDGAVRWSRSTGDAFGYDPDEIEPTWEWWTARIHPEDRSRVAEGFRRLIEDDASFWTEEYRFLTRDRGYATVFDRAHVSRDEAGGAVRVTGTMVNITERRRLHEGQRLLSQVSMILDLSMDYEATLPTIARLAVHGLADCCIMRLSAGGGVQEFGTAAHIDPRLQTAIEEVAAFLPVGPPVGSIIERVLEDGEAVLLPEVPADILRDPVVDPNLRSAAGRLNPRTAVFVPLRARRSVLGFAVFARSQDDRRYDEGDLRLAEELGRRIGLAVDHSRLFQAAELANRAKSDFLAVISHELRTPLTAVLGYADLLAAQVGGPLSETQLRQVDRIRAGSDRLLRLIEGILAYARLETGGERPRFENIPLDELVTRAEEIVAPRAAEEGVDFSVALEDAPATVRTDPDKFVQILLSLLTNAVKFTPQGVVRLRGYRKNGLLVLDVTDSGGGIAPEHLPYVFNPFWQAEQPATRRAGGAGLGLSVARRLARLMDGDVVVADSSPRGTTFRFQIPLHPGA